MKLLYDLQDIQNALEDLRSDPTDDLSRYEFPDAAKADLRAEARSFCRRKPLHTVDLWVVFVDDETQSSGYHAQLTLEWIAAEGSDEAGELYPSLNMAGVRVDAAWSSALYTAKQHFPISTSADVRWTVRFVEEPAVGSDVRYAPTKARNSNQELVGRSAGASFLIGLCALHHRALRKPVTLQEEVDVLARIIPLVVLPHEHSDCALAKLEGGEQAKLKALERHLGNLTLISSDTESNSLPANTIRVSTVPRLIHEIQNRLESVDRRLDQLRTQTPDPSAYRHQPRRRWPIFSWIQSREKQELLNRTRMIGRIQTFWIDGFLHQALNEVNQFNVGYELRPGAVLRAVDFHDLDLSPETDFAEIFNIVGSEVLILGAPGSGKTILLLQLAKTLLERARKEPTAKIPIVLNLSSWAKKQEPLDEWIVSDASVSYQIPRKVVRRWLDEGQIIPLLDGLDEVSACARATTPDDAQTVSMTDKDHPDVLANRIACLEAINEFRRRFSDTPIAVCSRIADYNKLQSKLDLRFAILQKPLDDRQVHGVTSREEMAGLRALITQESWLHDLCRIPFMLNAVSYAYANEPEPKLRLAETDRHEQGRRNHILDTYISKRLEDTRSARLVSAVRLRYLLSWLANQIEGRQSIFHLESLQMDALSGFHPRWIFCYASRIIFSVVSLVSITVVFTFVTQLGMATFPVEPTNSEAAALLESANDIDSTLGMIWIPLSVFLVAGHGAALLEWARAFSIRRPLVACFRLAVIALASAVIFHLYMAIAIFHALEFMSNTKYDILDVEVPTSALFKALLDVFAPDYQIMLIGFCWFICLTTATGLAWKFRKSDRITIYSTILGLIVVLSSLLSEFTWNIKRLATVDAFMTVDVIIAILCSCFLMSMTAFFSNKIEASERITWSWSWPASLTMLLTLVILLCLFGTTGDYQRVINGLAITFIFGGILFGFGRRAKIQARTRPNQGVDSSIRMGLLVTVLFFVFGFLIALVLTAILSIGDQLLKGTYWGFRFGTFMAAIGSIIGGFDVPVKHYVLRVLLWLTERIPLRLQRFLNSCVSHLMLRRVGGGYIFVHRYLLEHFAELGRSRQ